MSPDESPTHKKGQSGLFQAALSGLCPRCGEPTVFEAPARVAFTCSSCQLDFRELERGSRFAGVLTMLLAVILIVIAIAIDEALRPPLWLEVLVWVPVTFGGVIYALRLFKTAAIYRQYLFKIEKDK